MLGRQQFARACAAAVSATLLLVGLGTAAPADARTSVSTKWLLSQLTLGTEHTSGYDRAKFSLWADADGDGCDTRSEVLLAEGVRRPAVHSGCQLVGGQWKSKYDGLGTTDTSTFDIDHLVPLNEAWQSGAWRWNAATRKAYANDLGYKASLIAVSAHTNRSKGDREPQNWLPPAASYRCTYVAQWLAVKWRWHLRLNSGERSFLRSELSDCGWPRVAKPSRPTIGTSSSGSTGGTSGGGTTPSSNTVGYTVHPGAFCSEHWSYGHTSAGTLMRCTTTSTDSRFRWRSA